MTIALEHIQPEDWAAVNRVVDVLRSLVLDTGGVSLGDRIGVNTWPFPGGTRASGTRTVRHGLGRAPTVVDLQTTNKFVVHEVTNVTTTTFDTTAMEVDGNLVAVNNIAFYWRVIG